MSVDRLEEANRVLLHLLAVCPECAEAGGMVLAAYEAGAVGLQFSTVEVGLFGLDYLAKLSRPEEAKALLPKVRALSEEIGNDLDLLRVTWTEGLLHAAVGEIPEAIHLLTRVREDFIARGIGFDAALVTLDLSMAYLKAETRPPSPSWPARCSPSSRRRTSNAKPSPPSRSSSRPPCTRKQRWFSRKRSQAISSRRERILAYVSSSGRESG